MADEINTANDGAVNTYQIGPLTMEYVFRRAGLTNVADLQAVFDAVEGGFELKNKHHREAIAEFRQHAEAARYEDRA